MCRKSSAPKHKSDKNSLTYDKVKNWYGLLEHSLFEPPMDIDFQIQILMTAVLIARIDAHI